MSYTNPILVAVVIALCIGCAATTSDERPVRSEEGWSAELVVLSGMFNMTMQGVAGMTYTYDRPMVVAIAPDIIGTGGNELQWVLRHELFHVVGWYNHPGASPDDDVVIYMDAELPPIVPDVLPDPSVQEQLFMDQCTATIWVFLEADDVVLVEGAKAALAWWNQRAGRQVFRLRAGPATLK